MRYTEKELEKKLFTEEEIKRVIDEEYKFFGRINKNYSSIDEFNKNEVYDKYGGNEIIKDGYKYKLIFGSKVEKIFNTKEDVEKFLEEKKEMMIRAKAETDNNYFYVRASILYKNLQKKDSLEMSLELKEWIKKWIKKSIDFRNDILAQLVLHDVNMIVGNYLYIKTEDDNYYKINIHTLKEETVEKIDYNDFVITKDIK